MVRAVTKLSGPARLNIFTAMRRYATTLNISVAAQVGLSINA